MPMKRIESYQALWRPQDQKGHFWFTYFDGDRERTMDLDADSFSTMLKVLDTDKPIFADCATSTVAVHWPDNELKTGAWS